MIASTHALWKTFGRFDSLGGVDLSISERSVVALVGTNGAGKTTTIQLLLNIIAPTRGTATVLGVDSRRLTPAECSQIGYVFGKSADAATDDCIKLYPLPEGVLSP